MRMKVQEKFSDSFREGNAIPERSVSGVIEADSENEEPAAYSDNHLLPLLSLMVLAPHVQRWCLKVEKSPGDPNDGCAAGDERH